MLDNSHLACYTYDTKNRRIDLKRIYWRCATTGMANVEIKMLGSFEILVDGRQVLKQLGQSRKATVLVQYLVLQRGARIPHKTLTDALWGGERSSNPDMALRAILHRFRNMIAREKIPVLENCIVTSRGCYQWNPELPCTVDVFQMQDLAFRAKDERDAARRLELCEQIVALYRGRLLPLSASEPWVESSAVRLHGIYRAAMIELLEHYKKAGDSERLVALCEDGLEKNPKAERLYLELILALEAQERHADAQQAARRGRAAGALHHTVEVRCAGGAWRQARQADRNMQNDMQRLISQLPGEAEEGAMICPFETFGEIYRMQRGMQAQYGVPVFLALLTVMPAPTARQEEAERMMSELGRLIRTGLRRGDVAARYSETQYAVLMCGTEGVNYAQLEQIKQAFYQLPAEDRYMLAYSIASPKDGEKIPLPRRGQGTKRRKKN